ncbi:MAG: hypothetical protein ACKOYJ_03065 [Planctomycetia bacterium]
MDPLDPLEQLARIEVPPVPEGRTLRAAVHRRLNPRLLAMHVVEFAVGAMIWALVHMTAALAAALRYTLTGRWPPREDSSEKKA